MKWRAVGFVSVVLAAILLAAYLSRDRTVVYSPNAPTPVLIATQRIPKGTPFWIVAANGMYRATTLPPNEREAGAFADPSYMSGRATVVDILPGQQFTETNFTASRARRGGG
jgi:hypothetical protein